MSKKILRPTQQASFLERPMDLVRLPTGGPRYNAIVNFMKERERQLKSVQETGKSPDDLNVSLLLNEEIPLRHWQFLSLVYREVLKQGHDQPQYVTHTGEVFEDLEDFARFYATAESE